MNSNRRRRRGRGVLASLLVAVPVVVFTACSGSQSPLGGDPDLPDALPETTVDARPPTTKLDAAADGDDLDAARAPDVLDAADAADARVVDCSANPKLRNVAAGHFCAFAPVGANTCANNESCCNPSTKDGLGNFHPSFCAAGKNGDTTCAAQAAGEGSSYSVGSAWECADKNACPAASVCCLVQDPVRLALNPLNTLNIGNTPATDPNHPPACGVKQAYNAGGTRCRAACAAGEVKLCSLSDLNCGAGTTCKPFQGFFRDLGYCAP